MTALEFAVALAAVAAGLSVTMAAAFLIQQRTGNSGWIDACWTFGVGLVGLVASLPLNGGGWNARHVITAAFSVLWTLRLGSHIAVRTLSIKDDPRYAKLIRDWGADAKRQMFLLCQKQALVSIPLAFAIYLAAHNPAPTMRVQDWIAVAVLLIAIGGEALADHQLRMFQANPENRGQINDAGLWGWSRHPNYFFEWFGWLGFPLLAIDLSGSSPWGYASLAAPACMFWLLNYVSGVPPLEEHMLKTRGEAFRAYQRRTNAFFPAPPR